MMLLINPIVLFIQLYRLLVTGFISSGVHAQEVRHTPGHR